MIRNIIEINLHNYIIKINIKKYEILCILSGLKSLLANLSKEP